MKLSIVIPAYNEEEVIAAYVVLLNLVGKKKVTFSANGMRVIRKDYLPNLYFFNPGRIIALLNRWVEHLPRIFYQTES